MRGVDVTDCVSIFSNCYGFEHVIFRLFYILVCTYGPFIMMMDYEVILVLAQKRRPSREASFIILSEFASRLTHKRIAKRSVIWLWLYSYFERGCRKKCTRLSREALWVVLSSLFFEKFERIGTKGRGNVFASAKRKQQK